MKGGESEKSSARHKAKRGKVEEANDAAAEVEEDTPLMDEGDGDAEKGRGGGFKVPMTKSEIKEKASKTIKVVSEKLVMAKNNMKKSPWIVSIIIGIASGGVIASGVFGLVTYLVTLKPIMVVIKCYQILFACVCLLVEVSRYYNFLNLKVILHKFVPVFELTFGRGLLHILTAGLALAGDWTIGEALPGVTLFVLGVFNIAMGIQTARRVNKLFEELKQEIQGTEGLPPEQGILLIQQRFAALDLNGDGKVSKEELDIGCRSLNIELSEAELNMVFDLLDPDRKGFIGLEEFEQWWYSAKDVSKYLMQKS